MKRSLSVFLLLLAGYAQYAGAQQPVDSLNEQQRLGRQVLAQACGVCHCRLRAMPEPTVLR